MMSPVVGITQRVIIDPDRAERRDALEQSWVSFLQTSGIDMVCIPNRHPDPVNFARHIGIRGLILSGGNNLSQRLITRFQKAASVLPLMNDIAPERDITEIALLNGSIRQGWPVLSVCRGMQLLNTFYGGKISPVKGHAGTAHPIEFSKQSRSSHWPPPQDNMVNSYHNYGILEGDLAPGLQIWAKASDGTIEALVHPRLPHYGIMWHPERYENPRKSDTELFRYIFQER